MARAKAILKIITDVELLSERCDEVNVFLRKKDLTRTIKELKATLKANKDLMALAGPQLGYKDRVFCIKFADGEIKTFINPIITKIQGRKLTIENNPSIPGKEFMVQRPERILLGYQNIDGTVESDLEFKYPVSAVFDQMIDILDGILLFKYEQQGLEIDDDYYKASEEEKDEVNKWYVETYLPAKIKEIEDIAKDDKDIKQAQDAIAFLTKLANKEVELANDKPVEEKKE